MRSSRPNLNPQPLSTAECGIFVGDCRASRARCGACTAGRIRRAVGATPASAQGALLATHASRSDCSLSLQSNASTRMNTQILQPLSTLQRLRFVTFVHGGLHPLLRCHWLWRTASAPLSTVEARQRRSCLPAATISVPSCQQLSTRCHARRTPYQVALNLVKYGDYITGSNYPCGVRMALWPLFVFL